MRRKLLVFLVLALALLLARPPASLFDAALAHFTGDGLRLLQAEGSLWNGHGVLASRSPDGRSVAPWLPLAWRFDSAALTRGALRWVFTGSGKPLPELLTQLHDKKFCLLVGPEGGFSDAEREQLRALPVSIPFGMGPRILRADTAAVAAMACVLAATGGWRDAPHFRGGA